MKIQNLVLLLFFTFTSVGATFGAYIQTHAGISTTPRVTQTASTLDSMKSKILKNSPESKSSLAGRVAWNQNY
ncbi:hypothetical protein [Bdellovibrio sp. HCB337]|uniref:hypothetical protein n=1 Tax=Bdellovibrio sp. HCB337 TaxID=3394358 RepID=UPI0039A58101